MGDLSEFELIARLADLVEVARREQSASWGSEVRLGSGDDAAVTVCSGAAATSVDAFVEGVHFRREHTELRLIGRKAISAALSDIAAMGAKPGEAYVQLGIPEHLSDADCLEVGTGLAEAAAEHRVTVAGGDVTRAPSLILAVTVVGHADSAEDLVPRSGARAGDALALTGEVGGAAAGFLILDRPELADGLARNVAESLRHRILDPTPRLAAGSALARGGATAMIDVSDGLGADAEHIGAASGVRLVIDLDRVPVQAGVSEVASAAGEDPEDLATARGEDYELLATLPRDRLERARDAVETTGTVLTKIGWVEEGAGATLRRSDGTEREARGFDQLQPD